MGLQVTSEFITKWQEIVDLLAENSASCAF
jgi:hypothetical protein